MSVDVVNREFSPRQPRGGPELSRAPNETLFVRRDAYPQAAA